MRGAGECPCDALPPWRIGVNLSVCHCEGVRRQPDERGNPSGILAGLLPPSSRKRGTTEDTSSLPARRERLAMTREWGSKAKVDAIPPWRDRALSRRVSPHPITLDFLLVSAREKRIFLQPSVVVDLGFLVPRWICAFRAKESAHRASAGPSAGRRTGRGFRILFRFEFRERTTLNRRASRYHVSLAPSHGGSEAVVREPAYLKVMTSARQRGLARSLRGWVARVD